MHSKIHTCQPETVPLIASVWRRGNERRLGKRLFVQQHPIKKRQSVGQFLAGTYESCYAFWPFKNCGVSIFFKGYLQTFSMDFQFEGTSRSVNLLTLLTWSLKAKWCNFLRENCSGTGALSKQGYLPCRSIIRNSKRWTQNPSKSLKNRFWGKRTTIYHR